MFAKIVQESRTNPGSVPAVFMDHPPTKDRIIKAEEEIKNILPKRSEYLVSDSEFQSEDRLNALLGRWKRLNQPVTSLRFGGGSQLPSSQRTPVARVQRTTSLPCSGGVTSIALPGT